MISNQTGLTAMLSRYVIENIEKSLQDTPAILLNGPRQAGKSTLAKHLANTKGQLNYVTFDDPQTRALAQADPVTFLQGYDRPLVIDEVQRIPDLFLALKLLIDENRQPGQFILTGSANVMLLPKIADSLAGRMEIIPLLPLSQTEILSSHFNFVDFLFSEQKPLSLSINTTIDIWQQAIIGGYPEMLTRKRADRRRVWFESYITSILLRDIKDIANIDGLSELPNLFHLMATRAGGLLNFAELSRSTKLPQTTLKRYITLLQTTFLLSLVHPWSTNISKRFVKAPKIMLNDSGLLAHLVGLNPANIQQQSNLKGALLENMIFTEILKQNSWSRAACKLYHFRTHEGYEVDLVLEKQDKTLAAIEVKAASSISKNDFKGLQQLATIAGDQFHRGIVLYTGNKIMPFGTKMAAVPVTCLFGAGKPLV